jgi:hypothetical protein
MLGTNILKIAKNYYVHKVMSGEKKLAFRLYVNQLTRYIFNAQKPHWHFSCKPAARAKHVQRNM